MRAGKLNTRLALYRLPPDTLTPARLTTTWASLRGKSDGVTPPPTGLRHPTLIEIRFRWRDDVAIGDYGVWQGRLFHLHGLRDPDGKGHELIASAFELIGHAAVYTPQGGTAITTRAYVVHDSPYIAQFSGRVDYRTRIELPIFETGRASPQDTVTVASRTYTLLGLADNGDDGVVRQYFGHG